MRRERKSWMQAGEPRYSVSSGEAAATENSTPPSVPDEPKGVEFAYAVQSMTPGNEESLYHSGGGYQGGNNSSMLDYIRSKALPRRKVDQILRAQDWAERDDLVNQLIDLKVDFATVGFSLQCKRRLNKKGKSVTQEQIDEFQDTLNVASRNLDISKVIEDLLRDYFATDSMILYWSMNTGEQDDDTIDADEVTEEQIIVDEIESENAETIPGLRDICAINPGDCIYDDSLGVDILKVRIPFALRCRIDQVKQKRNRDEKFAAVKELVEEGVGLKWIKAVMSGQDYVTLDRNDGDNWIVRTKGRKHHGLAKPSMYTVFLSLEARRSFTEGDYSASHMMKHFIQLIQQGESIENGPHSGSTKNWLTKPDADALLAQFTNVSKTMRMVTNHTLKVTFVFPPKEMFDPLKYENCERRIYGWSGVVVSIAQGDGGTYSSGFIGIKKLVAKLINARRDIRLMFEKFFASLPISKGLKTPDGCETTVLFDEQTLKEPRQLLEEIKFLVTNGIMDPEGALTELGRDPDAIKARKRRAIKENQESKGEASDDDVTGLWEPVWNANKQVMDEEDGDKGGRPANDGTTTGEDTRMQRPSAGTS